MRDFRKLKVWEKSHDLALNVYRLLRTFPFEERFCLSDQMRRAAISVSSNIAEGCGRHGERELSRFIKIASGSISELEYQMLLARDLEYIGDKDYEMNGEQLNEVKRMLNSFIRKLEANS